METKKKATDMFIAYVAFSTLLYFAAYHFNGWFFSSVSIAPYLSLIYLPAAIRVLTVLVMGVPAAIGLTLGTLLTIYTTEGAWEHVWFETMPVSFISGFGPLLAVFIGQRLLKLPSDLRGLKPVHLLVLSIIGAACNAIPTNAFYWATGHMDAPLASIIQMFVGDVLGTLLFLWVAALVVKLRSA
jgi:hypothetical protein